MLLARGKDPHWLVQCRLALAKTLGDGIFAGWSISSTFLVVLDESQRVLRPRSRRRASCQAQKVVKRNAKVVQRSPLSVAVLRRKQASPAIWKSFNGFSSERCGEAPLSPPMKEICIYAIA